MFSSPNSQNCNTVISATTGRTLHSCGGRWSSVVWADPRCRQGCLIWTEIWDNSGRGGARTDWLGMSSSDGISSSSQPVPVTTRPVQSGPVNQRSFPVGIISIFAHFTSPLIFLRVGEKSKRDRTNRVNNNLFLLARTCFFLYIIKSWHWERSKLVCCFYKSLLGIIKYLGILKIYSENLKWKKLK